MGFKKKHNREKNKHQRGFNKRASKKTDRPVRTGGKHATNQPTNPSGPVVLDQTGLFTGVWQPSSNWYIHVHRLPLTLAGGQENLYVGPSQLDDFVSAAQ